MRLEIETALQRGVRVIPILVEGATLPRAEQLPASLAKLVHRQALELSPNRFEHDTTQLLRVLEKTIAQQPARKEAEEQTHGTRSAESQPSPRPDVAKPFLMPIEDVFTITGRGTVVTGRIEHGVIKLNEQVEIVGVKGKSMTTTVIGIEMFRKRGDEGRAGDNVGLLLREIKREEVERGQIVCAPGSITTFPR